jgi:hypothetical protein
MVGHFTPATADYGSICLYAESIDKRFHARLTPFIEVFLFILAAKPMMHVNV